MTLLPLISRKIIAIMAITSSMCMRPPALYPINPMAQAIINSTATMYKMFPMMFVLIDFNLN
jgi:hypothetical protein